MDEATESAILQLKTTIEELNEQIAKLNQPGDAEKKARVRRTQLEVMSRMDLLITEGEELAYDINIHKGGLN